MKVDPDGRSSEDCCGGDLFRGLANLAADNGYNRTSGFLNATGGAVDAASTMGVSATVDYVQGLGNVSGDNSALQNAALIDPTGAAGLANTVDRAFISGEGADRAQAQGELIFAGTMVVAAGAAGARGGGAAMKGKAGSVNTAAAAENASTTSRVGRWMSRDEHGQMQRSGTVQEGGGGQTHASTYGPSEFFKQAKSGSVYVEYSVPSNSLLPGMSTTGVKTVGNGAGPAMLRKIQKQGGTTNPPATRISPVIEIKN